MSVQARVTALAAAVGADIKTLLAAVGGKAGNGTNNDITQINGLTTPLSISQGGTGSTTGVANMSGATSTVAGAKGLVPAPVAGTTRFLSSLGTWLDPSGSTSDFWSVQPIGVPIPLFDHLTGASAPPTDQAYRYIKLTASDSYNTGVLVSESVSGSAPLVLAVATISLVDSPLNGQVVSLINTERRVIRAGSAGALETDQLQNITGTATASNASGLLRPTAILSGAFKKGDTIAGRPTNTDESGATGLAFDASLVVRAGAETRAKSIGANYYIRIK